MKIANPPGKKKKSKSTNLRAKKRLNAFILQKKKEKCPTPSPPPAQSVAAGEEAPRSLEVVEHTTGRYMEREEKPLPDDAAFPTQNIGQRLGY